MIADLEDARKLWEKFWNHLCDDLLYQIYQYSSLPYDLNHPEWDFGLFLINEYL